MPSSFRRSSRAKVRRADAELSRGLSSAGSAACCGPKLKRAAGQRDFREFDQPSRAGDAVTAQQSGGTEAYDAVSEWREVATSMIECTNSTGCENLLTRTQPRV